MMEHKNLKANVIEKVEYVELLTVFEYLVNEQYLMVEIEYLMFFLILLMNLVKFFLIYVDFFLQVYLKIQCCFDLIKNLVDFLLLFLSKYI